MTDATPTKELHTRMHIANPQDEGNVEFVRDRAARELGQRLVAAIIQDGPALVEIRQETRQPDDDSLVGGTYYHMRARLTRDELTAALTTERGLAEAVSTVLELLVRKVRAVVEASDTCPICLITLDGLEEHADNCPWLDMEESLARHRAAQTGGSQ